MYIILEVANTHGGDIKYIYSLVEQYRSYVNQIGIKFQPFKYDLLACEDYEWYSTYKELFFSNQEWKKIINKASESKDVWLDIFDKYGMDIFFSNFDKIKGIKLQSSVLDNQNIINDLKRKNLSKKSLIINVAGHKVNRIRDILAIFQKFSFEEIYIELGFQSYPTNILDSGLSKIKKIKNKFNNKIVFADHSDSESVEAIDIPVFASLMGADIIEKHIMHSELPTKYDFHSSIKVDKFNILYNKLNKYGEIMNQKFINDRETNYLNKTIQTPVINSDSVKGSLVGFSKIDYKRTNQNGLNYEELMDKFKNGFVKLSSLHTKNQVLKKHSLEKVKIGCIIAARLKSTRLKRKALLKIGNLTSIELCIKNCLNLNRVDYTILATSYLDEDKILEEFTYSNKVHFKKGHPDNVIKRYSDIIGELDIDVFVRVTGDMPYVSNEIFEFLLESHLTTGSDYTVAKKAAIGMNLEIINSSALKKVRKFFPKAEYSEYMTWYFQNNPKHFKLNFVKLPLKWVRDYRLTLDYREDLELFNKIESFFNEKKLSFNIKNLFSFLDNNPQVSSINNKLKLKYENDQDLIDQLNTHTKI